MCRNEYVCCTFDGIARGVTHANVEKRPGRNAGGYALFSVREEIYRGYFLVTQHHFGNDLQLVCFGIVRQQLDFSVLERNGQVRVNGIATQMRDCAVEVFAANLQNVKCRQTPGTQTGVETCLPVDR